MTNTLKLRTLKSFTLLFLCAFAMVAIWKILWHQPMNGGTPVPFRAAMELNGDISQALFKDSRLNQAPPPPVGKIPRVNGLIGVREDLDLSKWKLQIDTDALDPQSRKFSVTMADLLKLPHTNQSVEFYCVEGWSENMSFSGVRFSDFLKAYNIEKKRFVGLVTVDEEYYVSIDMDSMGKGYPGQPLSQFAC